MKTPIRMFVVGAAVSGALAAVAQTGAISPSGKRAEVLARLDAVLAQIELPPVKVAGLKDPFHPAAADLRESVAPRDSAPVASRSENELVTLLAAKLQPTGTFVIGGEPFLLFGEKRQKKGDKLTLVHEGVEYAIEIVNIENNQFRIRYKNEETTRPVK